MQKRISSLTTFFLFLLFFCTTLTVAIAKADTTDTTVDDTTNNTVDNKANTTNNTVDNKADTTDNTIDNKADTTDNTVDNKADTTDNTIDTADPTENISWNTKEEAKIVDGNNQYFVYFSSDGQYSWIYKVKQIKEGKKMKSLTLPETVSGAALKKIGFEDKQDTDHQHNLMGAIVEPYHNVDGYDAMPEGIKSVSIPSTVTELCPSAFCGFRDLERIEIPENVETLQYALFYRCSSLKEVVLPKKLREIESDVFKKCNSLTSFSISKDGENYCCVDNMLLSKNKKRFILAPTGMKNVKIPETVTKITSNAFLNTVVKKVSIPASVTSIEGNALRGKKLRNVLISSDNKVYAKTENCIYKKSKGELIAIINKDGNVTLSKQIRIIASNVSVLGKEINNLVIPKTVKKLKKHCLYGSMGVNGAIYFKSATPPKMEKGSFCSFVTYFVPEKSLKKYVNYYREIEELEDGEKGYSVFAGY